VTEGDVRRPIGKSVHGWSFRLVSKALIVDAQAQAKEV